MAPVKKDLTLAAAVDIAKEAAQSIAEPGTVGEYLGMVMDAERLATHSFVCTAAAYRGWRWAVVVARAPRSRKVTVCETHLLPGPDSVLAPAWVPYAERLAPGDLGDSDVLPYIDEDPHLEAGFEATGEEDVDAMALWELGLGRARVLSAEGREAAAQRWYDGTHGPHSDAAQHASAPCSSCGYYVPLAGALRSVFGVCAHAWSPSDGQVVSLDHGCGAHSETDVSRQGVHEIPAPIVDDLAFDVLT
ncbi:DUF3027 domain-containing protein [Gephyromycinifex aptenodytis]|uniref:DUF3027 domain-containing protein n=1 Tax=Gephyromycinifex aptenodytis TaxID=2716227 RepID=UPI0014484995|nr:DUF3027 domain-containing protein [Gephyromycinifex aptenodytis]